MKRTEKTIEITLPTLYPIYFGYLGVILFGLVYVVTMVPPSKRNQYLAILVADVERTFIPIFTLFIFDYTLTRLFGKKEEKEENQSWFERVMKTFVKRSAILLFTLAGVYLLISLGKMLQESRIYLFKVYSEKRR